MSIKDKFAHTLMETARVTAEAIGNHGHRLNALEAQLSHLIKPNPSLNLGELVNQPDGFNRKIDKLRAKLRKVEHELWTAKSALAETRNLRRPPVGEDTPNVE